jgi:threonyl-tRNA synthetase
MRELNLTGMLLLAASIKKLYPNAILGNSELTEEGFYYDFLFSNNISDSDLPKIEKQISRYIAGGYKFIKTTEILNDGEYKKIIASENKNIFYYQLINPANKSVEFSDFLIDIDMAELAKVKEVKLLSLGGAY